MNKRLAVKNILVGWIVVGAMALFTGAAWLYVGFIQNWFVQGIGK